MAGNRFDTGAGGRQQGREREFRGGGQQEGLRGSVMEGAQNIAETASEAWETTRRGAEQALSTVGDVFDDATAFMRRYPFATLGIGVALGFVLSMAFRSRNSY